MMKRSCSWLLLLLVLFSACHRKKDSVPEELSVPPIVAAPFDTIVVRDTVAPTADTAKALAPTRTMTLQIDTAEQTNLRLFTRKQKTIYNPRLLDGEWVLEGWHMVLDSSGRGERWNEKEDVRRDEADAFSWTIDSNLLYFEFPLSKDAVIPKMYVVTFVDKETLVYRNVYGTSYMWDRPQ